MLLDLPMPDLSFSSEQRSPAPASAAGVLGNGVSFSLVLNASEAAVPKAAAGASTADIPSPAVRTLPAVSMVKAQMNFTDMTPITGGQSTLEAGGAPIEQSAEQALATSIPPRIHPERPGIALPYDARILPERGNAVPDMTALERIGLERIGLERAKAEKPAPSPSILSHMQMSPQNSKGQPGAMSLEEQPLLRQVEPQTFKQVGSEQPASPPAPQSAPIATVRFHVRGHPVEVQSAPPETYEAVPNAVPNPPKADAPLPMQVHESAPNKSPVPSLAAPAPSPNALVEQPVMPSQRRMQSPQNLQYTPPVSRPDEAAIAVPAPAAPIASDLPMVAQAPQPAPPLRQAETLPSDGLGMTTGMANIPDAPAAKAEPILRPAIAPQTLAPAAAQRAAQAVAQTPPPTIMPSAQMAQKLERLVPMNASRELGQKLNDLQSSVSQSRQSVAELAPKVPVQLPPLTQPQTTAQAPAQVPVLAAAQAPEQANAQPPKITVDPNALALPVEKPSAGTMQPAPIAPTASNAQSPAQLSMPIGMPQIDAFGGQSNAAPANGAPQLRDAQPLERLVETISQMRESGQMGRGEVSLRHNQFGLVSMQVQSNEGELQARLASRDPGFVAAAQIALAERSVAATSDTAQTSSRQNDGSQTGQQSGREMGGSAQDDGRQRGFAPDNQQSGSMSTKGEHDAALSSADDHTAPKDVSVTQAAGGLFA